MNNGISNALSHSARLVAQMALTGVALHAPLALAANDEEKSWSDALDIYQGLKPAHQTHFEAQRQAGNIAVSRLLSQPQRACLTTADCQWQSVDGTAFIYADTRVDCTGSVRVSDKTSQRIYDLTLSTISRDISWNALDRNPMGWIDRLLSTPYLEENPEARQIFEAVCDTTVPDAKFTREDIIRDMDSQATRKQGLRFIGYSATVLGLISALTVLINAKKSENERPKSDGNGGASGQI